MTGVEQIQAASVDAPERERHIMTPARVAALAKARQTRAANIAARKALELTTLNQTQNMAEVPKALEPLAREAVGNNEVPFNHHEKLQALYDRFDTLLNNFGAKEGSGIQPLNSAKVDPSLAPSGENLNIFNGASTMQPMSSAKVDPSLAPPGENLEFYNRGNAIQPMNASNVQQPRYDRVESIGHYDPDHPAPIAGGAIHVRDPNRAPAHYGNIGHYDPSNPGGPIAGGAIRDPNRQPLEYSNIGQYAGNFPNQQRPIVTEPRRVANQIPFNMGRPEVGFHQPQNSSVASNQVPFRSFNKFLSQYE